MQLTQLRQEIMARAGDNSITSTQLDRWINSAIQQWASRSSWYASTETKETDTTTSETTEYTLPTNFKRMLSVKIGGATTTTEDAATELGYVRYEDKDVSGTVGYYINPADGTYGILPEPSVTGLPIFLKYYKTPAVLSGDTDTPPFSENYHELVIFFALKKYWEVSDDFGKASYYDREFENMIDQMKVDLVNNGVGSLPRVRDIREF